MKNFPLIGHIEHWLHFPKSSSNENFIIETTKKKNIAPEQKCATNDHGPSLERGNRKRQIPQCQHNCGDDNAGTNTDVDVNDGNSNTNCNHRSQVGFFFIPLSDESYPQKRTTSTSADGRQKVGKNMIPSSLRSYEHDYPSKCNEKICYQLIIPHGILQVACDVVRFRHTVSLTAYSKIERSQCSNNDIALEMNMDGIQGMIEVHNGGLQIHTSETAGHTSINQDLSQLRLPNAHSHSTSTASIPSSIMTLAQFQKEEDILTSVKTRKGQNTKKSSHQALYSITATVDAVSPIITAGIRDPFALIELYEISYNSITNTRQILTATIVLKGSRAIICQPGMQPGAQISLLNVRRQRWHVPLSFRKANMPRRFHDRAPSHVFVVTDPTCIVWGDVDSSSKPEGKDISERKNLLARDDVGEITISSGKEGEIPDRILGVKTPHKIPPLPSTALPLTSIEGKVLAVRYSHETGGTIRYIVIDTQPKASKLYLAYYLMSPELFLGLRNGSYVRAVNIHNIAQCLVIMPVTGRPKCAGGNETLLYGACLRSMVTLLACASEDKSNANIVSEEKYRFMEQCQSYPFHKVLSSIHATYCEMEWISQIRKEWYNKCSLVSFPSALTFESMMRVLLQRVSNSQQTGDRRQAQMRRDPYEEFFDHACSIIHDEDDIAEGKRSFVGCSFVTNHVHDNLFPTVKSLLFIRNSCFQQMLCALDRYCNHESKSAQACQGGTKVTNPLMFSGDLEVGWVASIHLSGEELCRVIDTNVKMPIFTGGIIAEIIEGKGIITQLKDRECLLSVSPLVSSIAKFPTTSSWARHSVGDFSIIQMHAAIVTCLYLGKRRAPKGMESSDENGSASQYTDLPPRLSEANCDLKGSTAILCVKGHIFIVSTQIVYKNGVILPPNCVHANDINTSTQETRLIGIEYFLKKPLNLPSRIDNKPNRLMSIEQIGPCKTNVLIGCLVRVRWKIRRLSGKTYNGYTLTLAHVPVNGHNDKHGQFSALQSIELKLNVPVSKFPCSVGATSNGYVENKGKNVVWQGVADSIGKYCLHPDIIPMAVAWWQLAEDGKTSSSLVCGWEEFCGKFSNLQDTSFRHNSPSNIYITFPVSACKINKSGYKHFECDSNMITAHFFFDFTERSTVPDQTINEAMSGVRSRHKYPVAFSHVGGQKILPGMVGHWLPRDILLKRGAHTINGESIMDSTKLIGVSALPLSGIQHEIFRNATLKLRHLSAPSLVRVLMQTKIIHLSFCRARAECTRCFRFLVIDNSADMCYQNARKDGTTTHHSTVAHSIDIALIRNQNVPSPISNSGTQSFVSLPPNIKHNEKNTIGETAGIQDTRKTTLLCPSGCHIRHAAIKWECSGLIEDGTGQAKLYSERNSSLRLMGEGLNIDTVELAAWHNPLGVTFTRNVPPKSHIKHAFFEAHSHLQRQKKNTQKTSDLDILQYLPIQVRAEYELERFCRESKEPLKEMDLLVRCKPLSGESLIDHTEVPIMSIKGNEGDSTTLKRSTFQLPLLKLSLVDCFLCHNKIAKLGWDIIRSFSD